MDKTLTGSVSVAALSDVETFLQSAQHLKALTQQLHALRCRESHRQACLGQQINTFTQLCGTLVQTSPRLAELWLQTQDELRAQAPGTFPVAPAAGLPSTAVPCPPPPAPAPAAPPSPPAAPGGGECSRTVPAGMRAGRTHG